MDVYVVSGCWWRDGATVIGAGADLSDAQVIADRYDADDSRVTSWSGWKISEENRWTRDALTADGVHPSLYQEIVRVPLAGYAEFPFPRGEDIRERMVKAMNALTGLPPHPGKMRCGSGEVWDWLRRGLDQMATYPSEKALPDSVVAGLAGIDVVLDPDLPPNVIKFATKAYVVGPHGDAVYEVGGALRPYAGNGETFTATSTYPPT